MNTRQGKCRNSRAIAKITPSSQSHTQGISKKSRHAVRRVKYEGYSKYDQKPTFLKLRLTVV